MKMSNKPQAIRYRIDRSDPCGAETCYVIIDDTGVTGLIRSDYALVEVHNPDGAWVRYAPALRTRRWPLRVGDTWDEPVTIETSSGQRQQARLKGNVVGYESVSVPAGAFMAFKIVLALDGRQFRDDWYAPETRTVVRRIGYDARGNQTVLELVDYQRSNEPAGGTP